jgi:hypothetical protein
MVIELLNKAKPTIKVGFALKLLNFSFPLKRILRSLCKHLIVHKHQQH